MAMKKKIAAAIGTVLITALCFGGSVFAESKPVNGTGAEESNAVDGTTDATVTYTQAQDPTWSVNIPKSVDFGKINAATQNVTKILDYSASISNNQVTSLKIALKSATGPSFAMKDATHNITVADAFTIRDNTGNDLTAGGTLLTLANGETGTAQAILDVSKLIDHCHCGGADSGHEPPRQHAAHPGRHGGPGPEHEPAGRGNLGHGHYFGRVLGSGLFWPASYPGPLYGDQEHQGAAKIHDHCHCLGYHRPDRRDLCGAVVHSAVPRPDRRRPGNRVYAHDPQILPTVDRSSTNPAFLNAAPCLTNY